LAPDALLLENLDAFYGDSHILHALSLAVPRGGVLALLGRNGAGKTTCLGAVMGLVASRGAILLGETRLDGRGTEGIARAGVGLVPQGRRIFPSLTVAENLRVASRAPKSGSAAWTQERVFATFPRLRERARQLAGWLSGGEQQMLAIGRALVGNPRVLLMDEPSEGLAPMIVAEVARVIASLREEGLSILLVEQNVRMALDLADQAAILTTGRCVWTGTAAELAARPDLVDQHLGVSGGGSHG
jgi:branched-chain amino acid transport system ATP-binding protein